mmetsp:Transcript_41323/g.99549  ORF Transcript_41323/g.99549 Transcript_41323/m.99549 type:complete len:279 (+) Transcript_41323:22-858(+)
MKPRRHLSSGSGSGSDSHDSSNDNGNKYNHYGQNSYNMTFVACDLCYNGEYPPKPRKKVSSWPTVTCKDIYYDLQSLNKHANPTQCYSKANEYRTACCTESTTARQSRSESSFPHPKFSTVFGIFIIWFIAREYVKSRRRLRDGGEDYDDSSIPPEEGADYKEMGLEENGKEAPQKLMKLGSKSSRRKRSSSGRRRRRSRSRRGDYDDDDSNASPVLSIIQMLISTPQHKQRNKRPQRGRSRRRSRSRSSSRSRSRGRRSKSRPIVLAEPDPPQMQLV